MHTQIKNRSVSKMFFFTFILIIVSCNKNQNKQPFIQVKDKVICNDSIVIYTSKKGRIECIYNILKNKEKYLKEGICFLQDGTINYDRSTYLEIKGADLHYHSPYDKSYKIGEKRFVVFKGNDSLRKDFSNINRIKLEELNFNENGIIKNFKKNIAKIGIVEETIILDTLIKSSNSNKKIIRTIEIYIDTDNLLINKLDSINSEKATH
jgi:hypothetical protein